MDDYLLLLLWTCIVCLVQVPPVYDLLCMCVYTYIYIYIYILKNIYIYMYIDRCI